MTTLIFDLETDGLLPELTRIHSLVIKNAETGEVTSCFHGPDNEGNSIGWGLTLLANADVIAGHNVIGFDIPAINKVYPDWKPKGAIRDTMILARLLWPKERIVDKDMALAKRGKFPKNQIGFYTLEAFGRRLGNYKGDFKGPWNFWSPEMQSYCEQDVEVTHDLWLRLMEELVVWGFEDEPWMADCVVLEHAVATIVARQERNGFAFDEKKAAVLYGKLAARREELKDELTLVFPPKIVETVFIPKVNNKARGYVKGVPFTKRKAVPFNPGSRHHVADRLKALGWVPEEFNKDGTPKLDDAILAALPYPETKPLAEYFLIQKRLGQLAEGKEAWLKYVRNGRIHGRVITNGAVTGRMTHQKPNMAQVPSEHEYRELFLARPGYVLVGCDADALELRCLAHFMAKHDGGAYIKTVLEGKKEEGTDMHTLNAKALGCARETAKTWFYAFIYGAGDWKLGYTLTGLKGPKDKITCAGRKGRQDFFRKLSAMGKLIEAVSKAAARGWLRGLDGRRVSVRSQHAALNTLLQSAGALIMKLALVILDANLQAAGLIPGKDYEFVANVHDEWQIETLPEHAEFVGQTAASAIAEAGDQFKFRCPLKGNYESGQTWADTH